LKGWSLSGFVWCFTPTTGSLSSFIMSSNSISFNFVSWNVRGLGDAKKCDIIKETLLNNPSNLVLFQETKLSAISQFKSNYFLPNSLQNFTTVDATNASRGILTAWNSSNLKYQPYQNLSPFHLSLNLKATERSFGSLMYMGLTWMKTCLFSLKS
jgi:hypothetical protein